MKTLHFERARAELMELGTTGMSVMEMSHRSTEFVALKCMNCDEAGLVRCSACNAI